ncbi:unnamed protein product [Paramecium pentaurelia]|uniref:Uncharacterized protein n=1 Tax=Paramecium pentaurelia TaxID=43138 RepID=A0A8S1UZM1_9CILI|nr:unnamed protein product [Paramecium pentaurelia]
MSDRKDLHQEELIIGFGLPFKYNNQIIKIEIPETKINNQSGAGDSVQEDQAQKINQKQVWLIMQSKLGNKLIIELTIFHPKYCRVSNRNEFIKGKNKQRNKSRYQEQIKN